ncbi:unnamed protein product [Ilex paraguariensis]|uniref:NAD(P)-binding domain-containing protein n=1 Tax=Ilex paraguariensis TaxID=185542 RepID=A0ABC8TZI2_9AQUA
MGEDFVRDSGLPFTIIRAGRLTDGPYTSYDLNTLLKATAGERRAVVIQQDIESNHRSFEHGLKFTLVKYCSLKRNLDEMLSIYESDPKVPWRVKQSSTCVAWVGEIWFGNGEVEHCVRKSLKVIAGGLGVAAMLFRHVESEDFRNIRGF